MLTGLQTFSIETGRLISVIQELCEEFDPANVLPEAKNYVKDVRDYISLSERPGCGAIDSTQIAPPEFGDPLSPNVQSEIDGYLLDATHGHRMGLDDNDPALDPAELSFGASEAETGSIGGTTAWESSSIQTGPGASGRSSSALKPVSPRKTPTRRNQTGLVHACLTEIRSGGAEWNRNAAKIIDGSRIFSSIFHTNRTVPHIMASLDKVDTLVDFSVLTRRFLLLCLADARKVIEGTVEQSRCAAEIPSGTRKMESEVLDIMAKQAFPETVQDWECLPISTWRTKHDPERKSIKNRLYAAKNWKAARDRFGSGIVTLFPTKSCRFVILPKIMILRITQTVLSNWTKGIARSFSLSSRCWTTADSFGLPENGNRTSGNVCRSEILRCQEVYTGQSVPKSKPHPGRGMAMLSSRRRCL